MDWRDHVETTGEVGIKAVADSLGVSDNDVLSFANRHSGARYVAGESVYLISKEDAELIEKTLREDRQRQKR